MFFFVMDYQKISFPESVKLLADKYNVDLKKLLKHLNLKNILFFMNYMKLQKTYQKNLFSKKGKLALNYLKERGLNIETIEKYKIGLSFNMGMI